MHYTKLTLGLFALAVRADLQLEAEDVPPQCSNICRPIVDLGNSCDVNDDYVPDDQTEDLLELQCVCTNDSFDVGSVAALCASCMDQNIQDRDDLDGRSPTNPNEERLVWIYPIANTQRQISTRS